MSTDDETRTYDRNNGSPARIWGAAGAVKAGKEDPRNPEPREACTHGSANAKPVLRPAVTIPRVQVPMHG